MKKTDFRKAISGDLQRKKKADRANMAEYFSRTYDHPKEINFKKMEQLNLNKFFYMPKLAGVLATDRNVQAVYPVLCAVSDFKEETFRQIRRENIAKLAGVSPHAVDEAINVLEQTTIVLNDEELPVLERKKVNEDRRRYWVYLVRFFRGNSNSESIVFHHWLIESGTWAKLSRNAKALYLAMRNLSFFDNAAYQKFEGEYIPTFEDFEASDWNDEDIARKYARRKWELCNAPNTDLQEAAAIPKNTFTQTREELEQSGLIAHVYRDIWQVWLRPPEIV